MLWWIGAIIIYPVSDDAQGRLGSKPRAPPPKNGHRFARRPLQGEARGRAILLILQEVAASGRKAAGDSSFLLAMSAYGKYAHVHMSENLIAVKQQAVRS